MEISEKYFESEICKMLEKLNYSEISNDFRENYKEVINYKILSESLIRINNIDEFQTERIITEINKVYENDLLNTNKNAHAIMLEGVKLYDEETKSTKTIKILSEMSHNNTYQFIRQLKVSDGKEHRIPDITIYVNGLPIAVMELKSSKIADPEILEKAFLQNESLKRKVPKLWAFNIINLVSNRFETRYGCVSSPFERMGKAFDLLTRDKENIIEFLFEPNNILDFINIYSYFSMENNNWNKYIAMPHQVMAVKNTIKRLKTTHNNKGGVIWHTQGSGKSVTMLMLAKALILKFKSPTLVFVTDRKELEKQLFDRFVQARDYLRNKAIKVDSRVDLIDKLENKKHFGLYFAMIQKWNENTSILSSREDVIIIADEAHRSQNNLNGETFIDKEKQKVDLKFGYAKYMRDAFPNAKLIGFTGTPLMNETKFTTEVFGDYNHKYLMSDSVDDGSTVPIYYEMRRIELNLDKKVLEDLDKVQEEYAKSLDINDVNNGEKIEKLSSNIKTIAILENPNVIKGKAIDIIKHINKDKSDSFNKYMIVASSRKAAFEYYKAIKDNDLDLFKKTILVMTSNNKDSKEMIDSIVPKDQLLLAGSEFKKANSKYKLAIVVDMWLTGFDVPELTVLYVDKLMQWHNLMQAIARVNRTYIDKNNSSIKKENGLIVDYIGIWKMLASAMIRYSGYESGQLDISLEEIKTAKLKLEELVDILDKEYIKGISSYYRLNADEKYNFLLEKYDHIKSLNREDLNVFTINAKHIKKLYKIVFSNLEENEIINIKGILSILTLLINKSIHFDGKLLNVIHVIKELSEKSVIVNESEIIVEDTKISKNIYDLAAVLAEEAEKLVKIRPHVAVELLEASIKSRLIEMEKVRPFFAQKISEKLKNILDDLNESSNLEKLIEILREIAKELTEKENEKLEFEDVALQAFYDVIADDNFLKYHNNSEILRKIAKDVLKTVRQQGIDQIENNPKIKSNIRMALRKMLKDVYDYPPDSSKKISGLLINELEKQIHWNYDYFKGE